MPVENRLIQQAFVFALDATPRQQRAFASHAGGARFAYNWGIQKISEALDAREAEKAAGQTPATKVPGHFDLCRMWTEWKNTAQWVDRETGEVTVGVPWVSRNFVGTYQAALRDAAVAWKRFFDSRAGRLAGRRVGRPRFKKKGRSRESFQVHGAQLRVVDAHHVQLPKIGVVKTHESTRKLLRRIRKGDTTCPVCQATGQVPGKDAPKRCPACKGHGRVPTARLVRGTVSRGSDGRWQIAFTVELVREVRTGPSKRQRAGGTIGVDLGVRFLATLSTGEQVKHPRHLEAALDRLAAAQRALARCEKGSRRRAKAVARVARLHARVANLRRDAAHKLTSHLVHSHERIAVEGWDVQQVMQHGSAGLPRRVRRDRNRLLADAGLGEIRWQLKSKAAWYGATVVVADPHAPTGRTCSRCGQVRAKPVPPVEELFACPSCGWCGDRRLNTARVLAQVARGDIAFDASSGGESLNARGGDVRPGALRRGGRSPVKREARAWLKSRGETGTPGP